MTLLHILQLCTDSETGPGPRGEAAESNVSDAAGSSLQEQSNRESCKLFKGSLFWQFLAGVPQGVRGSGRKG